MKVSTSNTAIKIFIALFIIFGLLSLDDFIRKLFMVDYQTLIANDSRSLYQILMMVFALISLLSGILFFISSFALIKRKKWSYLVILILGFEQILLGILTFFMGSFSAFIEIPWGILYIVLGYSIKERKQLFNS